MLLDRQLMPGQLDDLTPPEWEAIKGLMRYRHDFAEAQRKHAELMARTRQQEQPQQPQATRSRSMTVEEYQRGR